MGVDLGIGEALAAIGLSTAAEAAVPTALSISEGALAAGAGASFAIPAAAATTTAAAAGTGGLASALSTAGLVASGASGLLGAAGALKSSQAQQDTANYQAQVALNNRDLAGYQAAQAAAKGAADQERLGLRQKQQNDAILVSQAANNIDIGSGGSGDEVRRSQRALGQLDQLQLQHNTAQQIYGYEIAGGGYGAQADLLRSQAAQAAAAGPLNAAGSILSSATAASNQYLNWMRVSGSNTGLASFR